MPIKEKHDNNQRNKRFMIIPRPIDVNLSSKIRSFVTKVYTNLKINQQDLYITHTFFLFIRCKYDLCVKRKVDELFLAILLIRLSFAWIGPQIHTYFQLSRKFLNQLEFHDILREGQRIKIFIESRTRNDILKELEFYIFSKILRFKLLL
jgi:hypothetical protein